MTQDNEVRFLDNLLNVSTAQFHRGSEACAKQGKSALAVNS